jgi:beta-lactamase regulating signal transducer with metallopeptidase domain
MNYQESQTLIFLANAAIVSCLASGLGLTAAWFCRRRSISLQYGVLLWSVLFASLCPLVLLLTTCGRSGWLSVPTPNALTQATELTETSAINLDGDDVAEQAGRGNRSEQQSHAEAADWPTVSWSNFGIALASVWAVGTVVCFGSVLRGWLRLRHFRRSLRDCCDGRVRRVADDVFAFANMPPVSLLESPLAPLPLCLGFFRPAIVLPANRSFHLDEQQIRFVLLHEVAHLRRRDHWIALLQLIGIVLFWWNPLLRALNARVAIVREQMCDDYAVGHQKKGRQFAELLVQFAEANSRLFPITPFASALFNSDLHDLEQRVRRLLDRQLERNMEVSRALAGAAIVLGVLASMLLAIPVLRADGSSRIPSLLQAATNQGKMTPIEMRNETKPDSDGAVNLAGNWMMHLPAGFDHHIKLERIDPDHYRLSPKGLTMAGVYLLEGDRLIIEKPNDRRLTGFQWEIRAANNLLLVAQPSRSKVGANYLGATLASDQPTEQ